MQSKAWRGDKPLPEVVVALEPLMWDGKYFHNQLLPGFFFLRTLTDVLAEGSHCLPECM
jgi:hypothetical protein